jgi:hypothetical protein
LLHMNDCSATIPLNEKDLTAMARSFKFGSKKFDGLLPNVDYIISPFYSHLSNSRYPLGVSIVPAKKKKTSKILINTRLDARGTEYIHRQWTLGWLR